MSNELRITNFRLILIINLFLCVAGFFIFQRAHAAGSDNVMISQVMAGQAGAADNEFIELYNPTGQEIDLSGFSLKKKTMSGAESNLVSAAKTSGLVPAHGFFLIAPVDYKAAVNADLAYSGASYYISANNTVLLYDAAGALLDKVGYGTSGDFETQAAVAPDNGQSIVRKVSAGLMQDTDNNASDFEINSAPAPRNSASAKLVAESGQSGGQDNEQNTTPLNPPPPAGGSGGTEREAQKINFGDVVINELVSDPGDNEAEWIEIFNRSGKQIDLTGWRIEDGSKAKTNLSGNLDKYKVIEKPNGNLNNDGDLVILSDAAGKIIDQLSYGNWADGNLDNNAPASPDPMSLARKSDGFNTFNNANDFAVTLKPTKGAANLIEAEDEVSAAVKAKFDFSPDIYISELLPNPAGDDSKLEFIEIFNAGQRTVDSSGWSLSNEDGKKVFLDKVATSTLIQAGEYLALYRPKTKLVLHNDQGEVRLFQPLADKPVQAVNYKNVEEGWSYNNANADWTWSKTPTPGAVNVIKTVNHAPEVNFSFKTPALVGVPALFDGSDTTDADGDELKFSWDFGDGFKNTLANPEHTYLKAGTYRVKLEVNDGKEIGEKEKSVKVADNLLAGQPEIASSRPPAGDAPRNDRIIVNEVLPNPGGADAGQEWLELKNQGEERINLVNWRVENSNGKYKFAQDAWLEAENFYVLNNSFSKLALKNSLDVINLYNDLNELADTVEYAGAVQGQSYARGANGKWFWTIKLTPGAENAISVASAFAKAAADKASNNENADYMETDLEKVRDMEVGSLVKVKGTVAVEPGILGAQIFYIVGSPGMQIYNYKKDFPALKVGDYVEVRGELGRTQSEFRIKTKDKGDIKIDAHKPPPAALAVASDAVNEDNVGQLVSVTGEITDKKSSTLYLDDGNDEVLVYIKKNTGISTKNLTTGQTVAVTGILSKTQSGVRLLPRSKDDIVARNSSGELAPQVLGEVASGNEWEVAARDKKKELFKYLAIIAGGIVVVLAGLFIKARKKI